MENIYFKNALYMNLLSSTIFDANTFLHLFRLVI